MLRNIVATITLTVIAFFYSGCGAKELTLAPELQGKLYTQSNMWEEKSKVQSTNYARGVMIPLNSEVTINSLSNKAIVFTLANSAQRITLINVAKHSQLSSEELAKLVFTSKPVNLKAFSKTAQQGIAQGTVMHGMTKKEVLAARGYPPAILTPSLDANEWVYQHNRFVKRQVEFENSKVTKLVGWGTGNN